MRTTSFFSLVISVPLVVSACHPVEVLDQVSGTVLDSLHAPVSGVRVQAGAALVTTDSQGHFSLSNVTIPYDVTVAPSGKSAYLFLGLTGEAPTLRLHDQILGQAESAWISLDLPVNMGSSERAGFVIDRPDELDSIRVGVAHPRESGQVPVRIAWPGSAPTTVRIQAFRFEADTVTGAPKHYTGYDSVALSLTDAAQASWTASWKTPTWREAALSVSVTMPNGYQIFQSTLALMPRGASGSQTLAGNLGSSADVSFTMPVLDGASFDVTVCASSDATTSCRTLPSLAAGTVKAPLPVEPGPELLSPDQGASLGVGSEIRWSTQGVGPAFVLLYPTQPTTAAPSYYLAAAGESAVLPDLGALGVKLTPGLDYNLEVFRNSAAVNVDDLAAKGPFFGTQAGPSTYAYSHLRSVKSR